MKFIILYPGRQDIYTISWCDLHTNLLDWKLERKEIHLSPLVTNLWKVVGRFKVDYLMRIVSRLSCNVSRIFFFVEKFFRWVYSCIVAKLWRDGFLFHLLMKIAYHYLCNCLILKMLFRYWFMETKKDEFLHQRWGKFQKLFATIVIIFYEIFI